MIRELFIELYLIFYRIFFTFFKLFPLKNKIVILASFKENNEYIYKELKKQKFNGEIIFICKSSCYSYFSKNFNNVYLIESGKILDELLACYHIITAKKIIVDNYYGLLAVANFKKDVECIQTWHATGAIKSFGFLDSSIYGRSKRELKRIQRVYGNFHKCIIGSPIFGEIFERAFLMKPSQMLPFGFPRTDFYFNEKHKMDLYKGFFEKYPHFKGKKILLYAPTFRSKKEQNTLKLDIKYLKSHLSKEYIIIVRMHPSVKIDENDFVNEDFIHFIPREVPIETLMLISNYLITDYSSIPFEYAFLNKPIIFYAYDLDEYKLNPGFWKEYELIVPQPIVKDMKELVETLLNYPFEENNYEKFRLEWNLYSDGNSSKRFVQYLINK